MPPNPNKALFERFYNTHIDKVYRFVFFRVGGDKALAEDLVSEIFLKALEHFETYDEQISQSAWIMTIAKNHLANYWRDKKQVSGLPDDTEETSDSLWLQTAKKALSKERVKQEVLQLLERLDGVSRTIVTFHYLLGYSYAEIGGMLAMSETAVKVAAHRAIKKLGVFL